MKYGVREICNVVLRAKSKFKLGSKTFYPDEPVLYFDSLKTSSLEGAATTVYAQGGRGNTRLVAWDGERTLTFTMEDALISPESFLLLSGATMDEVGSTDTVYQHVTEEVTVTTPGKLPLSNVPQVNTVNGTYIYAIKTDADGNWVSEPYLFSDTGTVLANHSDSYAALHNDTNTAYAATPATAAAILTAGSTFFVDYYTAKTDKVK
jgi:hypothetical protein